MGHALQTSCLPDAALHIKLSYLGGYRFECWSKHHLRLEEKRFLSATDRRAKTQLQSSAHQRVVRRFAAAIEKANSSRKHSTAQSTTPYQGQSE